MVHAVEMAILTVGTSCMLGCDDSHLWPCQPSMLLGIFDARFFCALMTSTGSIMIAAEGFMKKASGKNRNQQEYSACKVHSQQS